MNSIMLETSQMLENHPLLIEKESYKVKYLNVLEYFSRKYSANDSWANQTLQLYIKKFLGAKNSYKYDNFDLQRNTKPVLATKFRPFKFFSYRYCLIIDCILSVHTEIRIKAKRFFPNYLPFITSDIKRNSVRFSILCMIPLFLPKELNRFSI